MAELLLKLDPRLPPDPAVVATIWGTAGIKAEPAEVCRMLLLAQLAEPLDRAGWAGVALLVGSALDAAAPEDWAEPDPEADEAATFARMAEALKRRAPAEVRAPADHDGRLSAAAVPVDATLPVPSDDPEPILIEDDDAPAEGGVPPEPEPVAEAADVEVAQAEPGADVAPPPEPQPELEAAPVEPEAEEENQPPVAGVWTARDDLRLVTLLFSGKGMNNAVAKMGRDKADCIQRYNALMPRPGSAAQAALVKRLTAQIKAEAGDGA